MPIGKLVTCMAPKQNYRKNRKHRYDKSIPDMFTQGLNFGREANFRIQQRIKQEQNQLQYKEYVQRENKERILADWENVTHSKIQKKTLREKMELLREKHREYLEHRRNKLAKKLASEEEEYRRELDGMSETSQERRERIERRARELREQREERRLQIANEKYRQKFRENCNELREATSRTLDLKCARDRQLQTREKLERKNEELEDEQYFTELWEQDRLQKLEREKMEVEKEKQMNRLLRSHLDEQTEEMNAHREQIELLKQQESALMRERWELEEQEELRRQREKREQLKAIRRQCERYDRHNQQIKLEEMRKERELDVQLLNKVLEKERSEQLDMMNKKSQFRKDMINYRNLLLEQMKKEEDESHMLDQLIQLDNEEQWEKRMQVWRKEQEARDKLMKEVISERKKQIQEKLDAAQQEREQRMKERARILKEIQEAERREREEKQETIRQLKVNQMDVRKQMSEKEQQRNYEQKQMAAEKRAQMFAEEQYKRMLAEEMARLEEEKPEQFKHLPLTRKRIF